jgi:hypothetical protein
VTPGVVSIHRKLRKGKMDERTHKFYGLWHLDLSKNSATFVITERRSVADGKCIRSLDGHFAWGATIKLCHSLDFGEGNKIAVLETMPCLVQASNKTLAVLIRRCLRQQKVLV